MATQYPADTVGSDGTVYPTVGENIRKSATKSVTAESISNAIQDNTDRGKVSTAIDITADDLKTAIVNILTGKTAYFGGLDTGELSGEQLTQIKTYLGIS